MALDATLLWYPSVSNPLQPLACYSIQVLTWKISRYHLTTNTFTQLSSYSFPYHPYNNTHTRTVHSNLLPEILLAIFHPKKEMNRNNILYCYNHFSIHEKSKVFWSKNWYYINILPLSWQGMVLTNFLLCWNFSKGSTQS